MVAAVGKSGVSHTTMGLFPPISSARIFSGLFAKARLSASPVRAEPVNSSPSMPGCSASAFPAAGPPITTRTQSVGTPAAR